MAPLKARLVGAVARKAAGSKAPASKARKNAIDVHLALKMDFSTILRAVGSLCFRR